MESVHERVVPQDMMDDLVDFGKEDTPKYDPCKGGSQMERCPPVWKKTRGYSQEERPVFECRNITPNKR